MSLFERLPLGLLPGHFYAMLRLTAWAQRGHAVARDLLFIQTDPPEIRRRRHANTRIISTASLPETVHGSPAALSAIDQVSDSHGMNVPKAPQRPVPDMRPAQYGPMEHVQEPELGYHKVVFSPSEPRLVRPRPVVASMPAHSVTEPRPHSPALPPAPAPPGQALPPPPAEEAEPAAPASSSKPISVLPDSPISVPALRPHAPMPLQQVSPLIQASLNARSEFKKASRQWRPKTFTVLSSSTGQFQPDKPHLLNGQEVSPQALSVHTKRRTTSATKLSSQLASQDLSGVGDSSHTQTIAPRPLYFGRERGVLPTWLREQYEEGNVLYPPPDPADASVVNVFDALHRKAQQSMNGSERAAASINRNTPFFPPHERDRERAERATANGSGPEQYRRLNEETSVGMRSSAETLGERGKLATSRSKPHLRSRRPEPGMASHTWGTQFESGTYAGFKTPMARDQRLQLPHVSSKRSFHYRPIQEFQPMLAMPHDGADAVPADDPDRSRATEDGEPVSVHAGDMPRLSRTQSLTLRPSETQRSMPGDVSRPRLKAQHQASTSPLFTHSRRADDEVVSRRSSRRMSKSKSADMSKCISTSANAAAAPDLDPVPHSATDETAPTDLKAPEPSSESAADARPLSQEPEAKDPSGTGDNSDAGTTVDLGARDGPGPPAAESEEPVDRDAEGKSNEGSSSVPADETKAEAAT